MVLLGRGHRRRPVVPRVSPLDRAVNHCGTCSGCVGTGLRGSSSQLFRIGFFSTSVNLHLFGRLQSSLHLLRARQLGDGEQDLVRRPYLASLSLFRRILEVLVADRASITEQREHCVASSHFLNLSVIAKSCDFDAVRHHPASNNKNSLQSDDGIHTSSTHCGMFQFFANAKQPQGSHELGLSLLLTSHSVCLVFPA